MNERLRTTMLRQGVTYEDLAEYCEVEPKTVERWISTDRVPHRRHRWAASRRLSVDEAYLWPELLQRGTARGAQASRSELVEMYPDRASVPRELWLRLIAEVQEKLDVLVLSGTFYAQTQPRIAHLIKEAVRRGCEVRLCFGNPQGQSAITRDREEQLGGTMSAKIRASLTYYRSVAELEHCQVRLHDVTLYASLFRYDDEILINPHAYGEPASLNPTLHLRRIDGGTVADHYISSFERVWADAVPWTGNEV